MQESESYQKIALLRCKQGNQAKWLCASQNCFSNGLICIAQQCSCQQVHKTCQACQIKYVLQKLDKKSNKAQSDTIKSYQIIQNILNNIIDQLSQIREKYFLEKEYFGFQDTQIIFLKHLQNNQFEKITGNLSFQLLGKQNDKKQCIFPSQEQIKNQWEKLKPQFHKFCESFTKAFRKIPKCAMLHQTKIKLIKQDQIFLNSIIQETMNKTLKTYKLLYRGSQNSFFVKQFHKKCDNIKNTVSIIQTQFDKIIGGFNPYTWNAIQSDFYKDIENKVFIFSLTLKEKYNCIKPEKSIYCSPSYGPGFGGNTDIYIFDQANTTNSNVSYFPSCFNLNGKYSSNQAATIAFIGQTNGRNFKVKQYEVYQCVFE